MNRRAGDPWLALKFFWKPARQVTKTCTPKGSTLTATLVRTLAFINALSRKKDNQYESKTTKGL
jgi:hypothetical protein